MKLCSCLFLSTLLAASGASAFISPKPTLPFTGRSKSSSVLGAGFGAASTGKKKNKKNKKKGKQSLQDALDDKPRESAVSTKAKTPFVKSDQEDMLEKLAQATANTCIGRAVASSPYSGTPMMDPFYELMPSLLNSRFPQVKDEQLTRVAGMIQHAVNPSMKLEDDIVNDPMRPHEEIHAYMPGLGPRQPFLDPAQLSLCQELSKNYDTIKEEYQALLEDMENGGRDRFQSVTSMNYESGWKTLVLFYNGKRIPKFPYHLCPVTTKIMESVPLAGRIAGFNRQQPKTGIPLHSDGNNMWLTCQMGIHVPAEEKAWIRVGSETQRWAEGECLLYDTTYEHETFNESEDEERVVLHVDFFNTIAMTPIEIEVMQYIYNLREEFMKAEGVSKVGAQIL